jgi:Activator of Hsp90 ATPase homolog 1-like protein
MQEMAHRAPGPDSRPGHRATTTRRTPNERWDQAHQHARADRDRRGDEARAAPGERARRPGRTDAGSSHRRGPGLRGPWPEQAFSIFIDEVGLGLHTVNWSWIQPERGRYLRFRRGACGRFVELHDAVTGTGVEIGRVTVWQPGARLALTWREVYWPAGASTDVDVRFEPLFGGTLVSLEHSGFERIGPNAGRTAVEYRVAWIHALGWIAARARAHGTAKTGG